MNIPKIKVSNMVSPRSGRDVTNQFVITANNGYYFQSYDVIIALRKDGNVYLDKNYWNYSMTTGKYRNQFLRETKKETEKKIKVGKYKLVNLN